MKELRNQPRFGPLVIKASIQTTAEAGWRDGYLTNVSKSGAFLAIDRPPARGEEVSLVAALPWSIGELEAHARVAWQRGEPDDAGPITGAGLEFVALHGESEARLSRYLERFLALAESLEQEQT